MNIQGMVRLLTLSAAAGAILALGGCEQQAQVGDDLATAGAPAALTQDHVIPTGQACVPTGKHDKHGRFTCTTCHQCAGTVSFDAAAAGAGAAFDATTKNCSNVACHSVPAGTFTYWVYDWDSDSMRPISVPYGGSAGSSGANWYATGSAACNVCHGYPPKYNGVAYAWHSGMHALGMGNGNACQLCHPDVTGAYVYGGPPSYAGTSGGLISTCAPYTYCSAPGTVTNPSMHANGTLDVSARFVSSCFGCH